MQLPRRLLDAVVLFALAMTGCAGRVTHETVGRDSTGAVLGVLFNPFRHENPFFGTVVYLIPNTERSRDWWHLLAKKPSYWLLSPRDQSLHYQDRTTCDESGRFWFSKIRPGDYFLHARGFWTNVGPRDESTHISGRAWVASTTVAAGETVRVMLRPADDLFKEGRPADSLPAFGEYVYIEELPEAVTKVLPEYPPGARRAAVDGTVLVQVLVGKDGRVKNTRIVKSIPMLDEAALTAVRHWVFKPALSQSGMPEAVWGAVPVRFTLN
jgi:TonB family protein